MDIILQGPVLKCTIEAAERYSQFDFVDKVIVSHWKHEDDIKITNDKIVDVKTQDPENIGKANINRQILSTNAGFAHCTSNVCAKLRSDQIIHQTSFEMMHTYFNKVKEEEFPKYLDGSGPQSKICVLGVQTKYPFHPQDHVFWGHTEDIKKVFDLPMQDPPLDRSDPLSGVDYAKDLRCTILIGAYYHARFDERIQNFVNNKEIYLLDLAPKRDEAMAVSVEYNDQVFKPFPKINMYWEKYDSGYWYDSYTILGERYG